MRAYSTEHRLAIDRYLKSPRLDQFTDADLQALLEDSHFEDEVARERARRAAPPPPPKASPATAAPQRSVVKLAVLRKGEALKDFYKRCRFDAVPLFMMKVFVGERRKFVLDMNAKNIRRNERLDTLEAAVANLRAERDALVARVFALEQAPAVAGVKWCGVHRAGEAYSEGSLVTRKGGLWAATRDTAGEPGAPSSGWQLIVKAGSYTGSER